MLESIPQCSAAEQQCALCLWWSDVGSQWVDVTESHSLASDVPLHRSESSVQPGRGKKKTTTKAFSLVCQISSFDIKKQPISINLTCMLAISLCSRTLASCARASCCWYHCLTCWSESISAWDVFNRFCRVLRSSWTCWSWLWRPPIWWRKSWTAKVTKTSHLIKSENK